MELDDYIIDLKAFWRENGLCFEPFSVNKPRVGISFMLEDHFVTHLIPLESTVRYYTDPAYAISVHVAANDLLERELGMRFYPEDCISYIKGGFEIIMGARRVINEGNTPWIKSGVSDIGDVKALIKRAEKMDMAAAVPDEWREAREKLRAEHGRTLRFGHGINGPATMACNMLGTVNTCEFIMEEPDVMRAYFEVMAEKSVEYSDAIQLEDIGYISREGWGVNDDDCFLFPPKQYELLCAPFMKKLFDSYAPEPHHRRRQHSDSNMGHLMGILYDLGIREVNFGPELGVRDIRKAMPDAVIYGQMPPFVLRNGSPDDIIRRVRDDIECAHDGGLVESLAGVTPESTPLRNIRIYMWAVNEYGRIY